MLRLNRSLQSFRCQRLSVKLPQWSWVWYGELCRMGNMLSTEAEGWDGITALENWIILISIQLFRERLSEKVHATIPKGIVGSFEFTVLSKKFERMAREAMDLCLRVLKESNKSKFDSYSVRNSVLLIFHTTFRDCRVHIFSDNLSRNSCILKQLI